MSLGTVALAQCVIVSDQAVQCVLQAGLAGGAAVPLELTARVLAAGVTATLIDSSERVAGVMVTRPDGRYGFANVEPDLSYRVRFSGLTPGDLATFPRRGNDDNRDSDADPGTLSTAPFLLDAAMARTNVDLGVLKVLAEPSRRRKRPFCSAGLQPLLPRSHQPSGRRADCVHGSEYQ